MKLFLFFCFEYRDTKPVDIDDAPKMWKVIGDREVGKLPAPVFFNRVQCGRLSSIQLSNYKEIVSSHGGAINSLQVDLTERRYLLSGASDASVALYDVQRATDYDESGLVAKHNPIFLLDRRHECGHKYAISSAIWYPIDTGLFITGSYDQYVNVWDTNTSQIVLNFKMPGKVYRIAMSSLATSHMLIASGTEDVQVRLCDMASGAFSHTLSGHRDGVMSVEWSASNEWILITGGCDGAIRFWDIRQAGCFLLLDQSHSQLGMRPSVLERSHIRKCASVGPQMPLQSATGDNGLKSSSSRGTSRLVKGSGWTRVHRGRPSRQDQAIAHYGAVTGLKATVDGMHLFSSGSDSRLRFWDIESGCNTLVNYETVRLQTSKGLQMAVTPDLGLVFVPCMTVVKAFQVWSGRTCLTQRAHYEPVNSCFYNSEDQELYTGGNDRQILVWSPSRVISDETDEGRQTGIFSLQDQDSWSD